MAVNPNRLKPAELMRLVNSTPLGEALNERRLRRHRTAAGMRISDDGHTEAKSMASGTCSRVT